MFAARLLTVDDIKGKTKMKNVAGRRAAKTCECFVIQSTSWPIEDILLLLFFNLCLKRERDGIFLLLARANLKKLRITSKSRALRLRVGEMIIKVVQVSEWSRSSH